MHSRLIATFIGLVATFAFAAPAFAGTIPTSFNDPRFNGNTSYAGGQFIPNNGTLANKDINDQSGNPAVYANGNSTIDTVRIIAREGPRCGGGNMTITNLWNEVGSTIANDHADGIQCYSPGGGTGTTMTITDSTFKETGTVIHTGIFSADDWRGNFVLNNVLFIGNGSSQFGLRITDDGGRHISMTNVYFAGSFANSAIQFDQVNGFPRLIADVWNNVRYATIDGSGNIIPGALISCSSTGIVCPSGGGDTTPPTAPSTLTATAVSSSQINLSWTASTDNVGVTGYQVFRGGTQVGTPTGTSFSDTGLTASTAYSYTVKAIDAAGNLSANSNTASATTQAGAPAPTATLSANPTSITSGQSSTLTWSSTNATSCTGSGFTASGTSGSTSVSPTVTTTYSISCTGAGGTSPAASATVTVTGGGGTSQPPTFVNEYETVWTTASPKTTASFSVQAGDILVASAMSEDGSITASISGGSLTWTQQQVVNASGYGWLSIWTATVDADKTMSVTFTRTAGSSNYGGNVYQFRNSSGIGASSKANVASGAPTLNLTTTQANSAIVVSNDDWTAKTTARTWRTIAGALTERSYATVSGAYTIYSGYHANAGAIGTYAVGLTAPTGQKYSIAAVEVKGSSGAPPPAPTATLSANPTSITSGQSSTLTWSSTNATSCTGTGFTASGTSGSTTVTPTVTTTYSITCTGAGGTSPAASATVTVTTSGPAWTNTPFTSQTGTFTALFEAVPTQNSEDTVIGLSPVSAAAFTDLAAIVRFSDTGVIDARNGGAYAAAATVAYAAGTSYHFREVVNVPAHTYSVYVTPQGGSETLLASDYAFRSEQAAATSLNYLSKYNTVGDAAVTNFSVSTTPPPTVVLTASPQSIGTGDSSTLSWSSTNASSCTGTNFSTGGATSGTVVVSPAASTVYTVSCTGLGGTGTNTITVTVGALSALPTISFPSGTFTWTTTDAVSCTASGGWTGSVGTSGSHTVSAPVSTTYVLTCTGGGTTVQRTITITTSETATVSSKFQSGQNVTTTSAVNVRSTPSTSGTLLGTQSTGAQGTVIGGPVQSNGYWWWQVDYATGPDGWSVENWLN